MKYLFLFCLIYIQSYMGNTQSTDTNKEANLEKAELFIEQLQLILAEERPYDFIPELVVTKNELRTFLENEWERTLSKRHRKQLQHMFEPGVEHSWSQVQRDQGYYFAQGFISDKNMYSDEKKITSIKVGAEFSDVSLSISEQYDKAYGEISQFKLYIISAKYITKSNPVYEFNIWFPCIFTAANKFKLIAHTKEELISKKYQGE